MLKPELTLKWLFFDLNSFFASVEQQENPKIRGKPVAVIPHPTDATCAIAASYEAKALGIKTGTKIYEAKQKCPDLVCVLARHDIYVKYHHLVFQEVEKHIHIEKVCSIDEGACLLMKNERSIQQIEQLVKNLKQGIRASVGECVTCSVGVAPNSLLAKIASDMQKPDGLVILEPDNYQHQLFSLKLSDLTGIGLNMQRRLNDVNIYTVEQLWQLSPAQGRQVWGSVAGEIFVYRLHGYDIPDKPTQKRMVGHSRILDPKHRAMDQAYAIARQLVVKACLRLRNYGLYARKFTLNVRIFSRDKMERLYWRGEASFPPAQSSFSVLKELKELWNEMKDENSREKLAKVSVILHGLSPSASYNYDFFDTDRGSEGEEKYALLTKNIDKLNKRFGKEVVQIGVPQKTIAGYLGTKISFSRVPDMDEFMMD